MTSRLKPRLPGIESKYLLILIPVSFGVWLLLTSTTLVLPRFDSYDGKRLLELCLIPLTLLSVLVNTSARQHFNHILAVIPAWVRILILVFFGLGLISAIRIANPAYPLVDVAMLILLPMTIVAVAISQQLTGLYFDKIAVVFITMTGMAVFVQELVGLLAYFSLNRQFSYYETVPYFFHPRMYNHIQTWTLPLIALLPVVFAKYGWSWLLSAFLIGAQWYLIFSMGARGTTVSLLVAMLIFSVVFPASRKYWLKLQVSGLVLGILFYISVIGLLNLAQPGHDTFINESIGRPMLHTTGRTDLWQHALDDAKQNPWLGAGPMRFACDANHDHHLPASPHSLPVQIIGEWGVPAFLVLAVIFIWLFNSWFKSARLIRHKNDYRHAVVCCLSISFLAAIVHINVSGLHIVPASQVTGMLVLGWLLGQLSKSGGLAGKGTGKNPGSLVLLFGLLLSVSVLLFAVREYDEMSYRTSYAQGYGPTVPRFWSNGRLCEYSF